MSLPDEFTAIITSTDDAGPYEIFGPDDTESPTPLTAYESVAGFWDVVTLGRNPHIRIYRGDEYVYFWEPSQPEVLQPYADGGPILIPETWRIESL